MAKINKEIYTAELNKTCTLLKMCLLLQKYFDIVIDTNNEFDDNNIDFESINEQLTVLNNRISAEITSRISADNTLQANIDSISNQFNWMGNWVANNEYHKGDVVNVTNASAGFKYLYICKTTHTSGSSFNNTYWELMVTTPFNIISLYYVRYIVTLTPSSVSGNKIVFGGFVNSSAKYTPQSFLNAYFSGIFTTSFVNSNDNTNGVIGIKLSDEIVDNKIYISIATLDYDDYTNTTYTDYPVNFDSIAFATRKIY